MSAKMEKYGALCKIQGDQKRYAAAIAAEQQSRVTAIAVEKENSNLAMKASALRRVRAVLVSLKSGEVDNE